MTALKVWLFALFSMILLGFVMVNLPTCNPGQVMVRGIWHPECVSR